MEKIYVQITEFDGDSGEVKKEYNVTKWEKSEWLKFKSFMAAIRRQSTRVRA